MPRRAPTALLTALLACLVLSAPLSGCGDGDEVAEASRPAAGAGTDTAAAAPGAAEPAGDAPVALDDGALEFIRPWTGDLDGMEERRVIRILTVYGPWRFFLAEGRGRGLIAELARRFEAHVNESLERGHLKVNVLVIPVARNQLIPALLAGRGDIIAAGLTITPEREKEVAFSIPTSRPVREILVTGPAAPALDGIEDLSGEIVYLRRSSSYAESVGQLNERLAAAGRPPLAIKAMPESLEDEDLIEMVNAGLLPWAIVDDYKVPLWDDVFTEVTARDDIVFREAGRLAWAMRKDSPKLQATVDAFLRENREGTLIGNVLRNRYIRDFDWAANALGEDDYARFEALEDLFRRYGERYGIEYLMAAAQGYQESRLDQSVRSNAGAIGVMQVLPSTAADRNVGIPDITETEPNIHAGIKYLSFIRQRYFDDPAISDLDQVLLSLAAYNAGPARIRDLRRRAEAEGYDPNVWFDNVEVMAARAIGRETVQYVVNIYRYYLTYRMISAQELRRRDARRELGMPGAATAEGIEGGAP